MRSGRRHPAVGLLAAALVLGAALALAACGGGHRAVAALPRLSGSPQPGRTPTPSRPPAGLRATVGYASDDACGAQDLRLAAVACSGAVPASLRRPLHLPRLAAGATCPVSHARPRTFLGRVAGRGPVYVAGMAGPAVLPMVSTPKSAWANQQVVVLAAPRYQGPVLIRGRQVNGPNAVGFGGERVPEDELQLRAPGVSTTDEPPGWRAWLELIRVRTGGCYAYQIDGTDFSAAIVFQARLR